MFTIHIEIIHFFLICLYVILLCICTSNDIIYNNFFYKIIMQNIIINFCTMFMYYYNLYYIFYYIYTILAIICITI